MVNFSNKYYIDTFTKSFIVVFGYNLMLYPSGAPEYILTLSVLEEGYSMNTNLYIYAYIYSFQ
jgi:hypothetical protein